MVKYSVILLLAITAFSSCREKDIYVFENAKSKMVLTAFLTPGADFHEVNLHWSGFSIDFIPITDALVELIDEDGKRVTLLYDAGPQLYTISQDSMELISGKTYRIEAKAAGQEVSSECTIPSFYDAGIEAEWDTSRPDPNRLVFRLRLKWKDEVGIKNYFRASASIGGEGVDGNGDPLFIFEPLSESKGHYLFKEEEMTDGYFRVELTANIQIKNFVPLSVIYQVKNTDQPYYTFHRELQDLGFAPSEPLPEPYKVYSNIKGGLGIFCSGVMAVDDFIVF